MWKTLKTLVNGNSKNEVSQVTEKNGKKRGVNKERSTVGTKKKGNPGGLDIARAI